MRDHERDVDGAIPGDTESRPLSLVKHPLFGVRAWRWRIRWGSRLKVNRCQVVVLGRWCSLVCDPAYRPMRWLVSQGTPFGLSLALGGGFSLVPSLIASSSRRRFTLEKDLDRTCMCVALPSRAIIVNEWDPLDARSPLEGSPEIRVSTDEARSSRSIAIDGGSIDDRARFDGIQWSSITRISVAGPSACWSQDFTERKIEKSRTLTWILIYLIRHVIWRTELACLRISCALCVVRINYFKYRLSKDIRTVFWIKIVRSLINMWIQICSVISIDDVHRRDLGLTSR